MKFCPQAEIAAEDQPIRLIARRLLLVRLLHGDGFSGWDPVVECHPARRSCEKSGDDFLRNTPKLFALAATLVAIRHRPKAHLYRVSGDQQEEPVEKLADPGHELFVLTTIDQRIPIG